MSVASGALTCSESCKARVFWRKRCPRCPMDRRKVTGEVAFFVETRSRNGTLNRDASLGRAGGCRGAELW